MSATVVKDARMELKTTSALKQMLGSAAALVGQDLSSFVLVSAEERAKAVLADYQTLQLSSEEFIRFAAAFDKPAVPTEALRALMAMESLDERE
ncbi:MAG: DUF1778 domain-containing protein [Gammaproteobacteria bacterium]|nr:DUF1778 domain-containing protein [Gammaproteobacteria bacterium]